MSAPPAATWCPRLRGAVTRVAGEDGVAALEQPRTGTAVKVGRVTRALVGLLDGATPLEAVLEQTTQGGASRADAEDALRALVLLGFVEGAGDAGFKALMSVDPYAPPVTFLEESRFTCHGSGECCRTYVLGPIEAEDVRRLERLDIAGAFPALGAAPYIQQDEQGRYYLARKDEHCVFLLDDARCGIHAKFGVEAKPNLCRLYPWRAQLTVAGLRIVDTSECSTFARSVGVGEPLREQLDRIRPLLHARHEIHHPVALLDREHPCDYGWISALEQDLLGVVGGSVGGGSTLEPSRLVLAVGRRALGFAA
ncbi:MAG: YkgJ family cysteine cluster protein, partial [Planctomycetota bacterium]